MKIKYIIVIILMNVGVYAQSTQDFKEAQSVFDRGDSQIALTILNKSEYLILNAANEVKAEFYFLKGNVLKDLAAKNIDVANNFTLASQCYQDVLLYENESGKYKSSIKATAALKQMKSNLVNGAMDDFKTGKFKESAEKSYKVYQFDKKDTLNLYNAAAASINAEDYDAAIKYYEQLKKINFSGKAILYCATNKKTKEEDIFISPKARESAIEAGLYEKPRTEAVPSKKMEVSKNLAYSYLGKKDFAKAETAYNGILEMDPNCVDAYVNLAYLKLELKKAISDQIATLGTSPKEMQEYDKLSAKKDDIARSAIPYLKKALLIEPKNESITKTLLGVYRSLDMTNEYNTLKAVM
ncbi:MAG: hypothetical protein ABI850_19420 [Flavobacterium sp.]